MGGARLKNSTTNETSTSRIVTVILALFCFLSSHDEDGSVRLLPRVSSLAVPTKTMMIYHGSARSLSSRVVSMPVVRQPTSTYSTSTNNNNNDNNDSQANKGNSSPLDAAKGMIKSLPSVEWESLGQQFIQEGKEISNCISVAFQPFLQKDDVVKAADIVVACDEIDQWMLHNGDNAVIQDQLWVNRGPVQLRTRALELRRYELLCKLMRQDYKAYVATASFLSPNRIPRDQLPNVQDIPIAKQTPTTTSPKLVQSENGAPLVPDCTLADMTYQESFLDTLVLSIFRKLVAKNTGGVTSDKPGIEGLLEQGRNFMIQKGQTPEAQHKMVYDTLGGLMTPVLPPFYRLFMSGAIPKTATNTEPDKQLGPWFYAPYLTSVVTPTFFAFLVGPSRPNRRKDGQFGGLVVEKCKFLQQSGCKGLCLHQCKLPAQQFFAEELRMPLTVTPNFETQECQWSFGEIPVPPNQDPSFPQGCLVGCQSRKLVANQRADLCSA